MNAAIIGCGLMAGLHAKSLRASGHRLELVVGREIAAARAFSERWGIHNYSDVLTRELLEEVDCVHICTPPMSHYQLAKLCLECNKHVVCEKPLCLSPQQCRELMELARQRDLVNAVNFNVRFYGACLQARETISQADFGKPLLIQCSYQQEFHALPEADSWRYHPELAGHLRATTEIGSHCIDLIHYWTGLEVISLSANFGNFNPVRYRSDGIMYSERTSDSSAIEVASEDAAVVSLKFSNGAIGNMLLSEVSHGRSNCLQLEVTGQGRSVWWDSEKPYHLNTAKKGEGVKTTINAFGANFGETVGLFIDSVYRDIQEKDRQNGYPDFEDGYRNALVCDAIFRSANNGSSWIDIQDNPK